MKKILAVLLTLAMVLGLAACGGSSAPAATEASAAAPAATEAPAAAPAETEAAATEGTAGAASVLLRNRGRISRFPRFLCRSCNNTCSSLLYFQNI